MALPMANEAEIVISTPARMESQAWVGETQPVKMRRNAAPKAATNME
jgi:hypothetical protein